MAPLSNQWRQFAMIDGMFRASLGWFEVQNPAIEYRSAEGDAKRLPNLAAQLVETKPDVLWDEMLVLQCRC
jgi:ABC-type uncharacterized transport system substrate-binding protein